MIKHHFYRPLIKYLTEPNGDQTWGEVMSLCVKFLFDEQHCVNIANKYKDRFPHFHNCVLSNYGIIQPLKPIIMDNSILQEALEWWGNMPCELKDKFPEPQSDEDILAYYDTSSEYLYDSMGY